MNFTDDKDEFDEEFEDFDDLDEDDEDFDEDDEDFDEDDELAEKATNEDIEDTESREENISEEKGEEFEPGNEENKEDTDKTDGQREEAPAGNLIDLKPEEQVIENSPQNAPICLKVEVGKFKMKANELFALKSGNMFELGKNPNAKVALVVDGTTVGHGELMRVGDVIGVRILEMGSS